MDRGYVYRPLPGNLRIKNKCQILVRPEGESYYRSFGDTTSVTLGRTIEETEVYSNETPDKDLAILEISKAEPTLTAVLRQITDFAAQILFQTAKPEDAAPVAVTDQAFAFVGMVPGDVADLGVQNVTEIDLGAGWTAGTHYQIDAEAGRLELIAYPVGVTEVEGTVSGTGSALPTYGLMERTQIRASILIRTNNRHGRNWEVELWIVQLRPDGDLPLGADGDEFGEVTVNGRLFPDPSKTAAFRFGRIRELPARVLA